MDWHAWLTLVVLAVMIVVLARDLVAPSVVVIGTVVVLLVAGVLNPAQAFRGFSNPAPITVAALYILARAVEKTGGLQPIVQATMGHGDGSRGTLTRLLWPSSAASSFLNNTPIVAMLVPQLINWADRKDLSPSRFLMPLSFAAILGGMVTLIGTSTNLLVSGLLETTGQRGLSMFELSPVGLPIALVGVTFLILFAPLLVPDRRPARGDLKESGREFVVHMDVVQNGPLDGVTVSGGRLRDLQGVFLVEIERDGELIAPVTPDTKLEGGDHLTFVGRSDMVVDLQAMRGLASSERKHMREFDTTRHRFFEAVIGPASPLLGQTLKEAGFRGHYQAAVVAIHRAGKRVRAKLGSIPLRVGDTLLVLSDAEFKIRWGDTRDFVLVSQLGGTPPATTRKAGLVGAIAAGIVISAATGLLPILQASLLAAMLLVILGVLTPSEARNAVDLDVILVIAGAFGIEAALDVTGLAERGAAILTAGFGGFGTVGGILAIVLATVILTTIVTNNAAAVLMFPIAMSTAASLGGNPRAFAVALAIAASASFLTPIAYQTNLMVYGPGGYRFGDYARLGAPLVVLVVVGTVVLVPMFWRVG